MEIFLKFKLGLEVLREKENKPMEQGMNG